MLTSLRIRNFKRLRDVEIELGGSVLFIGPNNSGKSTALQALSLWDLGLRRWREKGQKDGPVTVNRKDVLAVPVPEAQLLWSHQSYQSPLFISVSGVTNGSEWRCAMAFEFANSESFLCRPLPIGDVPPEVHDVRMALLHPLSGLAASEDLLQPGSLAFRVGEGRTSEVLRNMCLQIFTAAAPRPWAELTRQIHELFGVQLGEPQFVKERGQVTMSYSEQGAELDLICSGRGLQQTLLLLAHLYANPNTVLLLDEPDAHLEILRQRRIYQVLTQTAQRQGCQIIAASHSEVLLNEAADRDMVVALVGKPHRIDDRGSQVLKALSAIGFDQYYLAERGLGALSGGRYRPCDSPCLCRTARPRCEGAP